MTRRRSLIVLSVGVVFLAASLSLLCLWHVENPIPTTFYASGSEQTDELVIFLPGIGDDMAVFERAGFIDLLHGSPRSSDALVIESDMGYFWRESLPDRVYQDILLPFHERGYKTIILVGVSIGGYGALWINHEYGDWIAATVLLAPMLGRESIVERIRAAGGIASWRAQLEHDPGTEERVWVWIDAMQGLGGGEIQSLILGFGHQDKYQKTGELLAGSIPDSHVFRRNGGHKWVTWRPLWAEIVNSDSWKTLGKNKDGVDSVATAPESEREATRP